MEGHNIYPYPWQLPEAQNDCVENDMQIVM